MSDSPKAGGEEAEVAAEEQEGQAADLEAAWAASAPREQHGHPGAPDAGPTSDEALDPELMALPSRRARHPLISVVVILLSAYLLYYSRGELAYFFQPRVPVDLGEVSQAAKRGDLRPNRYVTLRGAPDRKHALLLKGRLSGYDSLFRLLESDSRVYVQRHRRKRSSDRAVHGLHTGRLLRLDDRPYAANVRAYLHKTMNVAHDFAFDAIVQAKREGASAMLDMRDRSVSLLANTPVWINVAYPGEWIVQFSRKAYATAEQPEQQLRALDVPHIADEETSAVFWRFVVVAEGEQLEQLMRHFADPKLHAGIVRRQVSYTVPWEQLGAEDGKLVFNEGTSAVPVRYRRDEATDGGAVFRLTPVRETPIRVPRAAALYISTSSKFEVPAEALVLVTGERPGDYWYYLALSLVLAVFIAINGLVLIARLRQRRLS